jgi:2-polyprenyl-3-methyl-5-hydroxy-6-metoxy-1,4-benzoquinol methylase
MKKISRLHDELYLKENRYQKPKDFFKYIDKVVSKNIKKNKKYDILDAGCAAGELLYLLEKKYKNFNLSGCDIRDDLLKKARKHLSKNVDLKKIDISKKSNFFKKKFDIIICSGVIGIFDNLKNFKSNLNKALKKNGIILLGALINEYDYNIFIKYEDMKNKNILQSGWNIWSIKKIKSLFKGKKIKIYRYKPNKDFKKIKNDPMRSWTINVNKKKFFTNATMQIQNKLLLKIY